MLCTCVRVCYNTVVGFRVGDHLANPDPDHDSPVINVNNNGTRRVLYCFSLQLLFFYTDTIAGGDR